MKWNTEQEFWRPGKAEYRVFLEEEDVPTYEDYHVDDVRSLSVGSWERTGGRGAILNLAGNGGLNDMHLHEVPAGSSLDTQQHLYEEIVYVVSGRGATVIGEENDAETYQFEWEADSLFSIPRNASYRHINHHGDEPALLISETDLPTLLEQFPKDTVFSLENELADDYLTGYSDEGSMYEVPSVPVVWESNFIPDISQFDEMGDYGERGAGGTSIKFHFPNARLRVHMSEFGVGTYKKSHRHKPGAHVLVLNGEGYTRMWSSLNPDEKMRIDWGPGSLIVPPNLWYHQHFNLSEEPARYVAFHPPRVDPIGPDDWFVPKAPHNQIEYVDEDRAIRAEFEAELEERGIENRMPEEAYTDPDYTFE